VEKTLTTPKTCGHWRGHDFHVMSYYPGVTTPSAQSRKSRICKLCAPDLLTASSGRLKSKDRASRNAPRSLQTLHLMHILQKNSFNAPVCMPLSRVPWAPHLPASRPQITLRIDRQRIAARVYPVSNHNPTHCSDHLTSNSFVVKGDPKSDCARRQSHRWERNPRRLCFPRQSLYH
jgi:hypothetical protein